MRLKCSLSALGLCVFAAVAAGGQTANPIALPADLRARVQDERFAIVTSIRGLPLGVREGLQKLFGGRSLDIAEPGGRFQASGAPGDPMLPTRRLVAAGCSYERCLVYYELGGAARAWRVALFHWTPEATRFEWGGSATGGLKTIDEVKRAVLAGTIKDPSGLW